MTITRRDLLAGSVVALGIGACSRATGGEDDVQRAQSAEAASAQEVAAAKDARRLLIRFEGMIAPIVTAVKPNDTVPVAVDFALLNVTYENPASHPHPPTLAIPRPLLKHEPSAGHSKPLQIPPDVVDGKYAYWDIRGFNLEFVAVGISTPIKTMPEKLPIKTTELAEPGTPADWNGLQWLPQMSALYGKPIAPDWRKLPAVASIVRLASGSVVEPPYTSSSYPRGDAPYGKYEMHRKKGAGGREETLPARLYKHFIRATVDVSRGVAVKFYERSSGTLKGTLDLHVPAGHETDVVLHVSNVPAEWRMPRNEPQEDTVAFGALYGVTDKDMRWRSKYSSQANPQTAEGCDCCVEEGGEDLRDALPPLDSL